MILKKSLISAVCLFIISSITYAAPILAEGAASPSPRVLSAKSGEVEETVIPLAEGQSLIIRSDAFKSPASTFEASLIDTASKVVIDRSRDLYAFYGVDKKSVEEMYCEGSTTFESPERIKGSHRALFVIKQTCTRGADARLFTDFIQIIEAPTKKIKAISDINVIWRGRGADIENIHDMCISGHKTTFEEREGKLNMAFEAFAEFQPDPEFGAVDKKDCVAPAARASQIIEE